MTSLMSKTPLYKFLAMDMWGRAGRAHHPSKGHFHPWIYPTFVSNGIRALLLLHMPPKACVLSCEEPIHYKLQVAVSTSKWELLGRPRADPTQPRKRLLGPQTFMELEMAVSQVIGMWRSTKDSKGVSLMEKYCKAGYSQRSKGKYVWKMWGNSSVFQEIEHKRATIPRGKLRHV